MNTNLLLPSVIVFIILFGLTLPVTYLLIRNVIASVKFIKELIEHDENGIIEKSQKAEMERRLVVLREKEKIGYFRYYVKQIRNWLKKHSFGFYIFFLFSIIVFSYLSFNKNVIVFPTIKMPEWVGLVFFPTILFLTTGYFLAKTEKTKFFLQFATVIYIGIRLLWSIMVLKTIGSIGLVGWFIVSLTLCIIHYKNWVNEHDKKIEILKFRLQEECYSTNLILAQYQELLEQRHDNKKHFNMLYHLNEERQITAMQEYLAQLEKERAQTRDVNEQTN